MTEDYEEYEEPEVEIFIKGVSCRAECYRENGLEMLYVLLPKEKIGNIDKEEIVKELIESGRLKLFDELSEVSLASYYDGEEYYSFSALLADEDYVYVEFRN